MPGRMTVVCLAWHPTQLPEPKCSPGFSWQEKSSRPGFQPMGSLLDTVPGKLDCFAETKRIHAVRLARFEATVCPAGSTDRGCEQLRPSAAWLGAFNGACAFSAGGTHGVIQK